MHNSDYDHYFQAAERRWRNRLRPDDLNVTVTGREAQPDEPTRNVHVYHHESFPAGGQTFTADLRELPPEGQPASHGALVERRRFDYHPAG